MTATERKDTIEKEIQEITKNIKIDSRLGYTKEFFDQLNEFDRDLSVLDTYKEVSLIRENTALVKFFKFTPRARLEVPILMPDPVTGIFRTSNEIIDSKTTNICKVIKANSKVVKKGDLVAVPYNKVDGEELTPEYLLLLQYQKASEKPMMPEEQPRKTMPKIELEYKQYLCPHIGKKEKDEEDLLHYILPDFEFIYKVKLEP